MNEDGRVLEHGRQKVFVVYNPKAGKEDQLAELRSALASRFTAPEWTVEIYQTTARKTFRQSAVRLVTVAHRS